MKLSKAIEIGELNIKEGRKAMPLDVAQALALLIEAGKAIQKLRLYPFPEEILLLPGEDPPDAPGQSLLRRASFAKRYYL